MVFPLALRVTVDYAATAEGVAEDVFLALHRSRETLIREDQSHEEEDG